MLSVKGMYLFVAVISVRKQELGYSVQPLTTTPEFYTFFFKFHLISFSVVRFYTEP